MKILVINCGSSSLKYQLIDMETEELMAKGLVEKILDLKTVKDDEDNLDYYETQVDGKYYR